MLFCGNFTRESSLEDSLEKKTEDVTILASHSHVVNASPFYIISLAPILL